MVAGPDSGAVARRASLWWEHYLILGTLLLLAAASWAVLVVQSRADMQNGFTMGMAASIFLLVWVVMMVAMMFPASAPMVLVFARVQAEKRQRGRPFVPTSIFVCGYLLIWLAAGTFGYGSSLIGERIGANSVWLADNGPRVTGVVLVIAGLYQLTPLKRVCLAGCQSPFSFITSSWREGYGGALHMGLHHGLYCLGCCWLLFVILFPLGMMNIALLAAISGLIFAEKVLPYGNRVTWGAATVLVVYGLAVIIHPALLPVMDAHRHSMDM
jgi:predicted metal-binding membrane protein